MLRTVGRNFNFNIDWWLPYAYNLSSCMSQAIWIENIVCTFVFCNLHVHRLLLWKRILQCGTFFQNRIFLVGCQCYITACLINIFACSVLYYNYYGTFSCDFLAIMSVLYINFQNTGFIYYITVTVSILLIVYAATCILQIIFAM